uniref:Pentatricopeptide repeat-containing protein n=1 Tax=Ananas comosus var. bracteatus TaxID=296719 RepID=A0A6V7QCC6_ANACO|nr:unnamed protein product [Ananas comosus var. bracteatus]
MNHILSTFNFNNPPLHKNHNEIRRGNGRFGSNRADPFAVSARFPSKPKLSQALRNHQTKTKAPLNLEGSGSQVFDEEGSEEDKFELSKEEEDDDDDKSGGCSDDSGWTQEELDAISALFDRPIPRKPVKPSKERSLPLPSPYKTRPDGIPTPKRHVRSNARSVVSSRLSFSDRVRKNPQVLVKIAREIAALPSPESDVSAILDRYAPFLRKGSLSMTIRELGHMGLPERALQTLLWAQKQQQKKNGLFPDDQILASTVQVLARFGRLKLGSEIKNYLSSASRSVLEAMARGFIRAGNLNLARKILLLAKDGKRTLDSSIHAKLILEAERPPTVTSLLRRCSTSSERERSLI